MSFVFVLLSSWCVKLLPFLSFLQNFHDLFSGSILFLYTHFLRSVIGLGLSEVSTSICLLLGTVALPHFYNFLTNFKLLQHSLSAIFVVTLVKSRTNSTEIDVRKVAVLCEPTVRNANLGCRARFGLFLHSPTTSCLYCLDRMSQIDLQEHHSAHQCPHLHLNIRVN